MWQLVKLRTDSIYLLYVCFNLRTIAVALVVVYSTDNISHSVVIEAGQLLYLGPTALWGLARQCRAVVYGVAEPGHRHNGFCSF